MSENSHGGLNRVTNDAVWRHTRVLFLAAALLFLVNIAIGFDNALSAGTIPRWQVLTHLHAGALGWITLSVIGLAFWLFTGEREVTSTYVRGVRLLGWLSILAFAAYITSIGIAFSQGGDAMLLLPIFGTGAMLTIWAAAIYALVQLRHQPVVTTVFVLVAGGLLVAALGATMGVLIGLQFATGVGIAVLQAHAPPMVFYLLLVASGIVEWIVVQETAGQWTRSGMAQALALVVGAVIPPVAFIFDLQMLAPLMLLFLFSFLILFFVRVGWRALYTNPLRPGVNVWAFFGTLWLVAVPVVFVAVIVLEQQGGIPPWIEIVLAHVAFVGMMTNLLFGVLAVRTRDARKLHPWAEPAAMWLINLGLVIFFGLEIAADSRLGALVMGIGVLLGVGVMTYRLLESPTENNLREKSGEGVID